MTKILAYAKAHKATLVGLVLMGATYLVKHQADVNDWAPPAWRDRVGYVVHAAVLILFIYRNPDLTKALVAWKPADPPPSSDISDDLSRRLQGH